MKGNNFQKSNTGIFLLIIGTILLFIFVPGFTLLPLVISIIIFAQFLKNKGRQASGGVSTSFTEILQNLTQEIQSQQVPKRFDIKNKRMMNDYVPRKTIKRPDQKPPYVIEKTSLKWLFVIILIVLLMFGYWQATRFLSDFQEPSETQQREIMFP